MSPPSPGLRHQRIQHIDLTPGSIIIQPRANIIGVNENGVEFLLEPLLGFFGIATGAVEGAEFGGGGDGALVVVHLETLLGEGDGGVGLDVDYLMAVVGEVDGVEDVALRGEFFAVGEEGAVGLFGFVLGEVGEAFEVCVD